MRSLAKLLAGTVVLPLSAALASAPEAAPGSQIQDAYRFLIVHKVVHPGFDKVNEGAMMAAAALEAQAGADIEVVYSAPQSADVVQQNQIVESGIATQPDGIILVSSEMAELRPCASRILTMHAGRVTGDFGNATTTTDTLFGAIFGREHATS